jgi:DNA-directed RNA polymerase specialized sigma24 family protein
MMTRSHCECLVCRLEKSLMAELSDEPLKKDFGTFAASSDILAGFPTPLDLVREIHTPDDRNHNSSADPLILELLKRNSSSGVRSIWQRILLQVFIPTIHRTTSQITASFPSLARDDVSQYILCSFLEFLPSRDLQTRRSHLAFTIARKLRRRAFRWAIHEVRGAAREETNGSRTTKIEDVVEEEPFSAKILLHQFLDDCQKIGSLSSEERDLLVRFKIEGVSCLELALRNGHSAVAIQHRIQRLLDKLRRIARKTPRGLPEQLELFPR